MNETPTHERFDVETDVLVIGSGAGALSAALTASIEGAQVLIVEKSGPQNTDLLLQWTSTGRPHYTVFRGIGAQPEAMKVFDATASLSLRVDGGAASTGPSLLMFSVQ